MFYHCGCIRFISCDTYAIGSLHILIRYLVTRPRACQIFIEALTRKRTVPKRVLIEAPCVDRSADEITVRYAYKQEGTLYVLAKLCDQDT